MPPPQGKSVPGRAGVDTPNDLAPASGPDASERLRILADSNQIAIANITGKRPLILLVDDEPEVGVLTQLMLCEEGYKVVTALDGDRAIAIFEKITTHISLVILDLIMPSMDGEDVFNRLRELDPGVSVVLSSGFTNQEKLDRMLAHGLRGFIAKPFTRQRLLEQVRKIVA
jgi:CheY-like chemotaxis protein